MGTHSDTWEVRAQSAVRFWVRRCGQSLAKCPGWLHWKQRPFGLGRLLDWTTLTRPRPRPRLGKRERSRSIGTGRLANEGGAVLELYCGCLHELLFDCRPACWLPWKPPPRFWGRGQKLVFPRKFPLPWLLGRLGPKICSMTCRDCMFCTAFSFSAA